MSSVEAAGKSNVLKLDASFSRKTDSAREFLPAALEILETPASPIGRAVGATIILFFAIAIAWASLGHVDIIATASGKVVPTGRSKVIQPLEAGIVTAIHVRDGDGVKAGEVLVELDQTVAKAERQHVEKDLLASQLDVARLSALRDSFATGVMPNDLVTPSGSSAADTARTRSAMRAQAAEQLAKIASINQQIEQKAAESNSVRAAIAKIDATLPLIEEETSVRQKAMEIQFGNRIAYLDAKTKLIDQQNERVVQQRKIMEIQAAREALERQAEQTKAGYERQVLSDLSDAEKKVAGLTEDLVKADKKVGEQVLTSPIDGTVQQLALHTVGGVVTPAQQLMTIVPADSHLEVEAMVSNRDIGFVRAGQPVEIKVDTFNFTRYGLLHGKVTSVSHDAIVQDKPNAKAEMRSDGALSDSSEPQGQEMLYSARVALDSTQMLIDGSLESVAPGMAVTVEIKTGRRRIIEYLFSPILRYRQESMRER